MKTKTKALVLAACAILLVVTTVFATMAFLTSQDTVVNTFTVGNVKINLDEAKVDEMGKPVEDADRVKANTYKLLPGHTYTKDPTVTVLAGSEECYVRILVTLDKIDTIDTLFPNAVLTEIFTGYVSSVWTAAGAAKGDGTRTYEFRYNGTVAASTTDTVLPALFSGFTMPDDLTGEQIAALKDAKMTIVAQAIQADGFNDDADAAWAAFPAPEAK